LNAAGQATCTTTFVGPLHPLLDAVYSGDANFLGGDLGQGGQLILVTARTAMSVVSSANPSAPGDTVTYTATVSPANQSGQIGFTDNGSVIAGPPPQQTCANLDPDVNGSATCTITYPNGGEHAIVASFAAFGGLSSYTSSTSPTLNQSVGGTLTPTATTLASSGNPSLTGQQVTYTATVTGGDLGGTVAFADGGITIAGCDAVALTAGHATCAQTYTAVGPHLISAAYNGDATSAASAAVTVNQQVNLSPPAAVPNAAVVNLGNGAARVTFTAPAAAIHHAIAGSSTPSSATGFNVYQGTSAGKESTTPLNSSRLLATATGYTITGLTTGKKYYFTVKALNARGTAGPASPEVNATPAVAPGAPTSLHATSGKGSARFTWVAPASAGGGKITGYNVYKSTTPGGLNPVLANPSPLGPTTTAYSASALLDGVTYYFTVRALNAVGTSSASNVASVIPASAPGAPNHVTAYRGKASVGLRWIAPDNTGGSAITGFNVYKGTTSGGESTTPVNASPLPATAVSYTATGLTNGTTYFFKVKAVNAVGAGSYSGQASAAAAATAPPPWPASLTAKAGVASAALTWTAPASTGGSAITGYNVYKATSPGGEPNTPVNSSPLAATARTFTVTGLSNAVQYYFTVKAVNAIGVGAPSDEASATPAAAATVPGAPINPKATAGAAKVTVTWATPSWNGGSAITGYNVYKGTTSGGESATPVNASPLSPSTKTLAVTGLTTGKKYYFFVKAINAIGISAPSSQVSATPS
jgi:titin